MAKYHVGEEVQCPGKECGKTVKIVMGRDGLVLESHREVKDGREIRRCPWSGSKPWDRKPDAASVSSTPPPKPLSGAAAASIEVVPTKVLVGVPPKTPLELATAVLDGQPFTL